MKSDSQGVRFPRTHENFKAIWTVNEEVILYYFNLVTSLVFLFVSFHLCDFDKSSKNACPFLTILDRKLWFSQTCRKFDLTFRTSFLKLIHNSGDIATQSMDVGSFQDSMTNSDNDK